MTDIAELIHDMLATYRRNYGETPTRIVLPRKLFLTALDHCQPRIPFGPLPDAFTYYSHMGDIQVIEEKKVMMDLISFDAALRAHYNSRGEYGVWSKNYRRIQSLELHERQRLKRTLLKRFGPDRKKMLERQFSQKDSLLSHAPAPLFFKMVIPVPFRGDG